jgi:Holliday junction resolvase RusA-like endonuclease
VSTTMTLHLREWVNANGREHYHAKGRKVAAIRERAGWAARAARMTSPHERTRVVMHLFYPPTARKRDASNLQPTAKAIMDGMTDARVWPDDNDRHVVGPDLRAAQESSGVKGVLKVVVVLHAGDPADR